MKKLMIAASIVCVAALAQAAAFSWGTEGKAYGPVATTFDTMFEDGDYFDSATSGTANRMQKLTDTKGVTWTYVMTLTQGRASEVLKGTINSYDSGAIYMDGLNSSLIYKPSEGEIKVAYDIVITGTIAGGVNDGSQLISDAITGEATYNSMSSLELLTEGPAAWTASVESVPEPFSGSLALLGLGAIALRRKMKKAKKA